MSTPVTQVPQVPVGRVLQWGRGNTLSRHVVLGYCPAGVVLSEAWEEIRDEWDKQVLKVEQNTPPQFPAGYRQRVYPHDVYILGKLKTSYSATLVAGLTIAEPVQLAKQNPNCQYLSHLIRG